MLNLEYIVLFIVGGLATIGTKYISQHISPKYAAILASLPISLLSAYFIIEESKVTRYISNYLKQTLIIITISVLYLFLLHNKIISPLQSYITVVIAWVIMTGIQLTL